MKILHTADLHLDSAFSGGTHTNAEARREQQREVLRKIFRLAEDERCDLILIAGDIFDTSFVTPETRKLCKTLFSGFAKPVIIAPGNHDPFSDGSFWKGSLPENVCVFSSTALQYFEFPELSVTVGGYAFCAAALPKNPLEGQEPKPRQGEKYMLLCAHCDLDTPTSRYAPVTSFDIKRMGFDYAALGHVHNPDQGIDSNIRYSGFPEGRSFDERGDGAVVIISDETGELVAQRRVISERRYVTTQLFADGLSTADEVENAIAREIEKRTVEGVTNLRIELCGVLPDGALPELSVMEKKEWSGLSELEIVDSTLCLPDGEYLQRDTTLRGEFYRSLLGALYSEDTVERRTALRALRIGLAAIEGRNFTEGGNV